jgi:hypothetical protein
VGENVTWRSRGEHDPVQIAVSVTDPLRWASNVIAADAATDLNRARHGILLLVRTTTVVASTGTYGGVCHHPLLA